MAAETNEVAALRAYLLNHPDYRWLLKQEIARRRKIRALREVYSERRAKQHETLYGKGDRDG